MFIVVRQIVEPEGSKGQNIVCPKKSHSTGCCPCRADMCAFVSFYMLMAIIASIFVGATLAREWYDDPQGETIFLCILGSFIVLVVGVLGLCKCCVSFCFNLRKSEPVLPQPT